MIKTDRLEIWAEDMEGDINPVLSIINDRMRKLEIGVRIITGWPSVPNDTPYTEIIALEKNWEVEQKYVAARVEVTSVSLGGRWFRLQI